MSKNLSFYEEKIKIKNKYKSENQLLYLLRIYWKIMDDLDKENKGYKIKNWKYENYEKLLLRLNEIDLNKSEYRMYFKDLIDFFSSEIRDKNDE